MSTFRPADVLADLHLLTLIAQTRSFTQTARRLGISRASVSARLRNLERAAGMSLVRRTTRSVMLTPAAAQLVDRTQGSFSVIEQSFEQLRGLAGAPRGLLRITAPVALGRQKIAPSIAKFIQTYPEIRLELDLSDRLINLAQEGFDVAVRHARSIPETYVARVLSESSSLLVASPGYLDRRGVPGRPEDLTGHDCLVYLRDGTAVTWSFEKTAGRKSAERVGVPVAGPFKANNSEVLREALIGGLGVGLLPDFSVRDALRSGELVPVLPAWRPVGFFGNRIYAVRPAATRAPRVVECMVEHLRRVFAEPE